MKLGAFTSYGFAVFCDPDDSERVWDFVNLAYRSRGDGTASTATWADAIVSTIGEVYGGFPYFITAVGPDFTRAMVIELYDQDYGDWGGPGMEAFQYEPEGATLAGIIAGVKAALLSFFRLLARKDAATATDHAADLALLNADAGSGAGAYANSTDALEALRNRGDAAWVTGAATEQVTIEDESAVIE